MAIFYLNGDCPKGCDRMYGQKCLGISLVVDQNQRLLGTITDGDIRRTILQGDSLSIPIQKILDRKQETIYPEPVS